MIKNLNMKINIEDARRTLIIMAASQERANMLRNLSDDLIIEEVMKHTKCFGLTRSK